MKIGYNKKTLYIILAILVSVYLLSLYLLITIDRIINGDLYNFGLEFNIAWGNNYWPVMDSAIIAIGISIILIGISLSTIYFYDFEDDKHLLIINLILFLAAAFVTTISLFFITQIEELVFVDLNQYGLQYDFNWTRNYYLLSRIFMGLHLIALTTVSTLSVWTSLFLQKPKQTLSKLISTSFLIAGALTFTLSIFSNSSLGVNAGLGLILIGLLTGYITSQHYIKKKILNTQLTTTYRYLKENLKKYKKFKKAIYLPTNPPKTNNSTVLILKNKNQNPTTSSKSLKNILIGTQTLIPPGNELCKLFEQKLNTDFAKKNLTFLSKNLPELIIEKLEIANSFQIINHATTVEVEFENSIYNDSMLQEGYEEILNKLGCPISSAIACAIAKSTGKFTIISQYNSDSQKKVTNVIYEFMQ